MIIEITDAKKMHHTLSAEHIKMIEFTKNSIRIIYKDGRTPDLTLKVSQIIFKS